MTRDQTALTQTDTTQEPEPEILYETLTTGEPVKSNVVMTDIESGETVFILPSGEGTMVVRGFKGDMMLKEQTLQMRSREADDEPSLTISSAIPSQSFRIKPMAKFIRIQPTPSPGLDRILARDRAVRRRALEWRQEHGDPIEGLAELGARLIGDSPEDIEAWLAIVDEPY